jgi:hypothetical protein
VTHVELAQSTTKTPESMLSLQGNQMRL